MHTLTQERDIPGTPVFDRQAARRGYALNKMCFSFNSKANRDEFLRDEVAYAKKYGLNDEQIQAIVNRDVLKLIGQGGGAYYLGKLVSGVLGLDMQDLGAIQTGLTKEQFQKRLEDARRG